MKFIFIIAFIATAACLAAGSLDYLSNQSGGYFFSASQNAATDSAGIVPYNPAGTALMDKGFYIDLNSQTLFKTYTEKENALLKNDYKQTEPTPILPDLFLVDNFGQVGPGKLAVYANGGICAGGGSLDWKDGTVGTNAYPSSIAAGFTTAGYTTTVAGVSTTSVEASSVYYGLGGGVAYSLLDDKVSASAGVRYTIGNRTGKISASMPLSTGGTPWTLDVDYDYKYNASGFTPIFGLDVRPIDKLTVGMRYEMETSLNFKYETNSISSTASVGTFQALANSVASNLNQDGQKAHQDLPQILSIGAEYAFTPQFAASLGSSFYFMSAADMNGLEDYFGTGFEINCAARYKATDKLMFGGTFMYSNQAVKDSLFESDANLNTVSANPPLDSILFGLGAQYAVIKNLDVQANLGYIYYLPRDATTASGLKVSYAKQVIDLCFGVKYKI